MRFFITAAGKWKQILVTREIRKKNFEMVTKEST